MLIPDGDWAYPERMSNYYFRMPLQMHIDGRMYPNDPAQFRPNFKKVIFNDPATIILWNDGTKTVVKCGPDDIYDPEKGYVMCLLKRFCGNDTAMFHKFLKKGMKQYIPKEEPTTTITMTKINYELQRATLRIAGLSPKEADTIMEMRGFKKDDKGSENVQEPDKQD